MTSSRLLPLFGAACLLLGAGLSHGQNQPNLLKNGDLVQGGEGENPPNWTFSAWNLPNDADESAKIEYGLFTDEEGVRGLRIASKRNDQTFVWWQQEIPAEGGAAYVLKFRAKGTKGEGGTKSYAGMAATFHFLNAEGKFLGAERLVVVEFSDTWEDYEARMTIPEEAAKMGVRLSLQGNMEAEAFFTGVVLSAE